MCLIAPPFCFRKDYAGLPVTFADFFYSYLKNCPVHRVVGKLFGGKGYIFTKITKKLFERGLHLFTNIKSNMKNKFLLLKDKLLLRKRVLIETVNDQLKNISQIEHTRHRSVCNFLVNALAALVAYMHQPKKPRIKLSELECKLLEIKN